MAREPIISRTCKFTEAEVMCINVATGEAVRKTLTAPREYKSDEKLLKKLAQIHADSDLKPVHVLNRTVKSELRYMTEADFIQLSKVKE